MIKQTTTHAHIKLRKLTGMTTTLFIVGEFLNVQLSEVLQLWKFVGKNK